LKVLNINRCLIGYFLISRRFTFLPRRLRVFFTASLSLTNGPERLVLVIALLFSYARASKERSTPPFPLSRTITSWSDDGGDFLREGISFLLRSLVPVSRFDSHALPGGFSCIIRRQTGSVAILAIPAFVSHAARRSPGMLPPSLFSSYLGPVFGLSSEFRAALLSPVGFLRIRPGEIERR